MTNCSRYVGYTGVAGRLGPGDVWAQETLGPRGRLGPKVWAQGTLGPKESNLKYFLLHNYNQFKAIKPSYMFKKLWFSLKDSLVAF